MKFIKKFFAFVGWAFASIFFVLLVFVLVFAFALKSRVSTSEFAAVKSDHAVAVVELLGEIHLSKPFIEKLKRQVENEKIKAVVVKIDSPGGVVGASEEIYRYIKEANETKPIVCSLGSLAASGGLFSAMGCKKIVTNKGTMTGSIGVIFMSPYFGEVMKKLGLQMNIVKSGKFKDTGSPFREKTAEDQTLMQDLIDQAHQQFVSVIAESRQLEATAVREFADGRIILGERAVQLGIADEIGGIKRAAKVALELTGDDAEPSIIMPRTKKGIELLIDEINQEGFVERVRQFFSSRLLYKAFLA